MRTKWTKKEEDYLKKCYLSYPIKRIAEKLGRSESSVKHKAGKMGLNHYTNGFNAKTVARCFNSDVKVVIRWIEKFGLPCKRVICDTQTRYVIDVKVFWKWAEEHRDIINWSKYESMSMCPESKWLKETVRNYGTSNTRKKFTEQEIITIKNLLHRGLGYKEIAKEMERSYYSIKHLCRKIYV